MGLTLLQKIVDINQKFEKVYVINRGRKYWENESMKIINAHKNVFAHIKCDRDDKLLYANSLLDIFR